MRERKADLDSFVGTPARFPSRDGKITPTAWAAILGFLEEISAKINGQLSFGSAINSSWAGNMDAQRVEFVTPGVADTQFSVPHGLGRTPVGRIVVLQNKAGELYDSNTGGWGPDAAYFKCATGAVTMTILLF